MGVRTAERIVGVSMKGLRTNPSISDAEELGFATERGKEGTTWLCPPRAERNALACRVGRGIVLFVGAGAVEAGHGDIQQAEIDSKLCAMVNQVVHHNAANTGYARHREDLLATGEQLPTFHHLLVAYRSQRRSRLRGFFVKSGQSVFTIFDFGGVVRRAG